MIWMLIGLFLFLGLHSVRLIAPVWRAQVQLRFGVPMYRAVYSVLSVFGLLLVIWGFDAQRDAAVVIWTPPLAMHHVTFLLTWCAFVLLAMTYIPNNSVKNRFHHPMLLAVKSWAVAHLLSNGSLAHWILFGSFLLWSVVAFVVLRKRERQQGIESRPGSVRANVLALVVGTVVWIVFAVWLHGLLIGVKPLA